MFRSERMCAMVSASYFERLWCVYELCTFTQTHGADADKLLFLSLDWPAWWSPQLWFQTARLTTAEEELFQRFSARNARCFAPFDRAIVLSKIREEWGSEEAFDEFVRSKLPGVLLEGKRAWASRTRHLFFAAFVNLLYIVFEVVASTVNGGGIGWLQRQQSVPEEQERILRPAGCSPSSPLVRWWDPEAHGRAVLTVFDDVDHADQSTSSNARCSSRFTILLSTLAIETLMGMTVSFGFFFQQGSFGTPAGYGETSFVENLLWSLGTVSVPT